MKKNLLYFLFPLVGLLVFVAVYMKFDKQYAEIEEHKKEDARAKAKAKLDEEAQNRDKAYKDALAAQELRKKEKAEKEARDKAEKDAREADYEARRKANQDQLKLKDLSEHLQKEIDVEKAAILKLQDEKKISQQEEDFLKQYVQQAKANAQSLYEVNDKITEADRKRAEAEAAAAKAAAKNNS